MTKLGLLVLIRNIEAAEKLMLSLASLEYVSTFTPTPHVQCIT